MKATLLNLFYLFAAILSGFFFGRATCDEYEPPAAVTAPKPIRIEVSDKAIISDIVIEGDYDHFK